MTSRPTRPRAAGGVVGRVSLGVFDQLLSSASNFVALLVAARLLPTKAFGAYALASTTYIVLLGTCRALCGEGLLVRSGSGDEERRRRAAAAVTDGFTIGIIATPALVAAGLATIDGPGRPLLVLAATIPFLLMQDTFRYSALARDVPKLAVRSDLIWLILQVPAYALVFVSGNRTGWTMFLAWAATGSAAGLYARFADGIPMPLTVKLGWVRSNIDLGGRYVLDFLAGTGVAQVASYALAGVVGITALGALRGAQTIFGPMNVLISGAYIAFVPEAQRMAKRSVTSLTKLCVVISLGLAFGSALFTAAFLVLPDAQGRMLLGSSWKEATSVLLPVGLASMAGGVFAGASTGIRALEGAKELLRARVFVVPFTLAIPLVGVWSNGLVGAAYGIAAASWWSLIWWWRAYARVARSYPSTDGDANE